jgi:signal transduction histidine kinase
LELILANLVSNAAKYTLQGCVEISVSRRGIATLIEVKDTGIGISEDKKEKIFEPFERAHNTREINVESTGLGLAIARQMAETLGGTLSVESILGQGSRFILRFETKQGGGTDGKNLEKD